MTGPHTSPNGRLIHAATFGTLRQIRAALAEGAEIGTVDRWGRDALACAASRYGQAELVRFLMKQDASRGTRDGLPLHGFAMNGWDDLVQLALSRGQSPDAVNRYGETPLLQSISYARPSTVALLLRHGALANLASPSGVLPLHMAWESDSIDLLLAAGAAIDATNQSGETALMAATKTRQPQTVTHLIARGAALDAVDRYGQSALIFAAIGRCQEAFVALLDAGADRTVRRRDGVGLEDLLANEAAPLRPVYAAWCARAAIGRALATARLPVPPA